MPGIGENPIVVKIDSCGSDMSHSSICLELYEVDSNYGISKTDENNNWAEYKIKVE